MYHYCLLILIIADVFLDQSSGKDNNLLVSAAISVSPNSPQ